MNPSTCAACGFAKLKHFYEVRGVPVQSNLLVSTREEALNFQRGDVTLARCERCGFIFNTSFDPTLLEASERYEATQDFSPTFTEYAKSLAERWVRDFDLRGKTVLEIGCGDGEFLGRMLDAGAGRAVGYDPAAKSREGGRAGLEIHRKSVGENALPADFILCRHTLEHVPKVNEFLQMLRRQIGDRPDVRVGFEVPDTTRVLAEGAFWDVYYEHCSYFTEDSLRSAFARAGFEALDVRAEYDNQYLVLEAAPAEPHGPDRAASLPPAGEFANAVAAELAHWRENLARAGRVALWGAGSKAAGFLNTLGLRDEVACVVDVNPRKAGSFIPGTGQPVVLPEGLLPYAPDMVIVMNPIYRSEIERDLNLLGIDCELTML